MPQHPQHWVTQEQTCVAGESMMGAGPGQRVKEGLSADCEAGRWTVSSEVGIYNHR